MLRSVAVVLALLHLLMPPGMCLCNLVPCHASADPRTPPRTGESEAVAAPVERGSCCCKQRRARQTEAPTRERAKLPAQGCDLPQSTNDSDSPATPGHLPGCPALAPMVNRVALPTGCAAGWVILPCAAPCSTTLISGSIASPFVDQPSTSTACSLFLTQCTLLI